MKPNTPNWEKPFELWEQWEKDLGKLLEDLNVYVYFDYKKGKQLRDFISSLLFHQEQEVREETLSCRLLWERLGEWNKEWQAENPKERKLHFNDSLKLIEWKMGKTKQEVKKEIENSMAKVRACGFTDGFETGERLTKKEICEEIEKMKKKWIGGEAELHIQIADGYNLALSDLKQFLK